MKNNTTRILFAALLSLGFAARSHAGDVPLVFTQVGLYNGVTFGNAAQNSGPIVSDGLGHYGVATAGAPGAFGALTATTFNGNTLTTGTYTLTGAAGKTLTFSNTLTLAGTDGQTETFPAVSDTIAGLGTVQTFSAAQTFTGGVKYGTGLVTHNYNNFATAGQTPSATTRTVITGSGLTITAGQIQVGTIIHWQFDMTKTGAGTASSTIDIAFGTTGTTSDTAQVSFTKPAGTAVIDEGTVIIEAIVKTNSSSGVVLGNFTMTHNLAATGHMTIPVASVENTSSTFNTTTPTNIELCITTGASDAITINQCSVYALNL